MLKYFEYNTSGTPLGFVLNDTQYIYITNNSGDVMAIADSSGNIIARYSYDEWGKVNKVADSNGTEITDENNVAIINPLRYRGYYYDNETGYYYLQSRYYDPEICRFINADLPEYAKVQMNETAGLNTFAYCCNDPVNNVDYTGFKTISVSWISTPIDIAINMFCSGAAISYNVISGGLKYTAKKFGLKRTYRILMGIFPRVKGIYSAFYTAIQKVVYKVAAKAINKMASYTVKKLIYAITKIVGKGKWDSKEIYYSISMFFSFGAFIAGLLDFTTDGKINGRIKL